MQWRLKIKEHAKTTSLEVDNTLSHKHTYIQSRKHSKRERDIRRQCLGDRVRSLRRIATELRLLLGRDFAWATCCTLHITVTGSTATRERERERRNMHYVHSLNLWNFLNIKHADNAAATAMATATTTTTFAHVEWFTRHGNAHAALNPRGISRVLRANRKLRHHCNISQLIYKNMWRRWAGNGSSSQEISLFYFFISFFFFVFVFWEAQAHWANAHLHYIRPFALRAKENCN